MIFGVVGWLMKRLGWPRPPMVLGLVIGGIFERYLYISTSLYGIGWLWRPVVLVILALVAWALFRPFAEIVRSVVGELRQVGKHKLRFSASAAFTVAVIAFIITAISLSADWPAAAKPVPLTACYMALVFASLNLVNELFGRQQTATAGVDGGVATGAHAPTDYGMPDQAVRRGAVIYFLWLGGLMGLVALIGFIPAIFVFILVYMHFGFKEPALPSAIYAFATTFLCWGLFHKLLAVAWPQSLLGDLFPALRASLGFI
jgi:putative tricarboxylic transport membrane protein